MEYEMFAGNEAPIVIGATGLEDIMQCMRTIVRTTIYSCPMDRGFATTGKYVDSPIPHAVALRIAELTEALEKREPRIKVTSIHFVPLQATAEQKNHALNSAMDGSLAPVIRFRLRQGVKI